MMPTLRVQIHMALTGRLAAASLAIALAACGTVPMTSTGPDDDGAGAVSRGSVTRANFEKRLRERALSQGRRGRLAEAATSWEILTVLRPETHEYRDRLEETRRQIDTAIADRLQRGAQALKRGESDAAAAQYLAALALQPDNDEAAQALRNIERDRNKRSFLGKPSRVTLTRRAINDSQMAASSTPRTPLDRNELEHAAMLGMQGELDDAIALLERYLAVDTQDAAACHLLADMYYQKAEKQLPSDKPGAISALAKSLCLDASNTRAATRLKELKNGSEAVVAMVLARESCESAR
ncbi:MAG: hypothetical protein JF606_05970 [Burkholderiales bacterium]|jgi:tetratricopeptide (TPR) repeat protein|nr:hypothetical protein [Burkholderiales bacterium]